MRCCAPPRSGAPDEPRRGEPAALSQHVRANWQTALLICRKCSKKVDGGFGPKGKTPLAKALKSELHGGKGRKARVGIVEVKCLGICPKNAVTMIDAARPRDWLLVRPGTDVRDVVAELGLGAQLPT